MDLVAYIEQEETRAAGDGSLSEARQDLFDRFLGRPYGDEAEGRSQAMSRDVQDTIEWMMPTLVKLFLSGDAVITFNPTGPEDIEAAEQESDYLNHLLLQKNDAFIVLYQWFHDALLQRNGYAKAWWETREETKTETYEGLSIDELLLIQQDTAAEIEAAEQYLNEYTGEPVFNVRVKRNDEYGCLKVACVPPENVLVSVRSDKPSLADCDFVEHWEMRTISDLRADGFDVSDDIGDEAGYLDDQTENRDRNNESWDMDDLPGAMRRVKVRECWLRYDEDGDGLAELRHVILVGKTVLVNEETDVIPVACISPRPMSHRHNGLGVADLVLDLQRVKTVILRGMMDNLYMAIHGRWGVDQNQVNLDDLLTSRPGGVVRFNGPPGSAIMPLASPVTAPLAMQAMEYLDTVKENRSGMSRYATGTDANALNKTATGIVQLQSAAMERVLLIARVFAETGVKELFQIAHALTLKHQRKPEIFRLRGKWVPVDPRQWRERKDMTISVGLGTGNKDQQLGHLTMLFGMQKELLPLGIATPQHVFNLASKLANAAGFRSAEEFFQDPANIPPAPPQPNPMIEKAQIDAQSKERQAQIGAQVDMQKALLDQQTELQKADMQVKSEVIQELIRAEVGRYMQAMQQPMQGLM